MCQSGHLLGTFLGTCLGLKRTEPCDSGFQNAQRAPGDGLRGGLGRPLQFTAECDDLQFGEEPDQRPQVALVGAVEAAQVAVSFTTGP